MKSATRFLPLLVFPAAALLMAANIGYTPSNRLTIHEWGTFTSVAGADGAPADWYALGCKSDLPEFVNDYGYRGFKSTLRSTVRMETPVLYFYSQRELNANVKVSFPQGLITEWYPKADYKVFKKASADGPGEQLPGNLDGIDTSFRNLTGTIEWRNIKVEPNTSPLLPVDKGGNRYYAARATDSAPLTVGDQHEKFLFYRGVGRFPVPLLARVSEDGRIAVENGGRQPVSEVILFENRGGRLGYRRAGSLQSAMTLTSPSLDGSLPALRRDLESMLVREGLFPKEAHAMVETWRDSWFEEGSRLIYILPTSSVDAILPLQIDPAPMKRTRVFVGRIELITPETIRTVASAIASNDLATFTRYDRFMEPIMARIHTTNPTNATDTERLFASMQNSVVAATCR
jgi:hypothetical protein